jgi:NADH dehydrogenase
MSEAMELPELSVVTGALGYTGKYIARRIISFGGRVRTLTGHPDSPNPFADRLEIAPLDFSDRPGLTRSLTGASTLYNTYWIRFARGDLTFERAVENSRTLIGAAVDAGVGRLVHISITNASADSRLPYFRGKGLVEQAIADSGLSYAIVRPTVIFGREDVLVNNIAWALRRFSAFPVLGDGSYRLQPVFVEDVARIAVDAAQQEGNLVIDAAGPEAFTYEEMVQLIGDKIGSKARTVHTWPGLALLSMKILGFLMRDVVLTHDEVEGLMDGLLASDDEPARETKRLSDWLDEYGDRVGRRYASELARHYR